MNWDALGAIGELVGAVAVVVTLVYLALQIRSLKAASLSESVQHIDQGERDLHQLYIDNAQLIRKANEGEALAEDERFILNEIFLSTWVFHFYAFYRATSNGRDPGPPTVSFVHYLRRYPGFTNIYESEGFRNLLSTSHKQFLGLVDTLYSEGGT